MFALGFVSVFDQILEGLPEPITQEVFKAYVDALQEDPQQFRRSVPAGAMHLRGGGPPEASRGAYGRPLRTCVNVASELIPQAKYSGWSSACVRSTSSSPGGVYSRVWSR